MTVVACADGRTLPDAEIDRLALGMPSERLQRWRRIRHRPTARSAVLGFWLARVVLDRACDGADPARSWSVGERGKPLLAGGPPFNLAHTDGIQVCAVSTHAVGVDVERVAARVVEACGPISTPQERAALRASADPVDAATRLWATKESFVKRSGHGLCDDLAETDVDALTDTRFEAWQLDGHWIVSCDHTAAAPHGELVLLPVAELARAGRALLAADAVRIPTPTPSSRRVFS